MQMDEWTRSWAEFDVGKIVKNGQRQTTVEDHDHLRP